MGGSVSVADDEGTVWARTDVRELNWGRPFVDYEPAHSWWFARKVVRVCAADLRLFACLSRKMGSKLCKRTAATL